MSARHWLERDPKDSPGLQRIQEAQQAAAAAKAQAEQQARKAAIATQEAERKRLEMIARIEQKTAQVLPLLEEIRDYANQTATYPVGPIPVEVSINDTSQVIKPAELKLVKHEYEQGITLRYGFKGHRDFTRWDEGWLDNDEADTVEYFGISFVPFGVNEGGLLNNKIVSTLNDELAIKKILADAFHNPIHLGYERGYTVSRRVNINAK